MLVRIACLALLPLVAERLCAQAPHLAGELREIRIRTGDVFADGDSRPLEQLVNALHWQTRRDVVERELWFAPGDTIDSATAAELERNLRALGLFAEVIVAVMPTDTPGLVDLEVVTRDRLSLNFGAGGSYVGGVTGFRGSLGESNLFGLGDRIAGSFARNSEDEYRGSLAYTDLHLLDSWHTATVRLTRSDEGESGSVEVRRPFKHLADPRAHGGAVGIDEAEADYYRGGDTAAEVPYRRDWLAGDITWGAGPRHARRFLGVLATAERFDYGLARGPLAGEIRVPGDTDSVFVGPTATWQWITAHRKVEGLDTLDYVQDLTLGPSITATLGARWRDEDGVASALQPELGLGAGIAAEPLPELFTNVGARGALRVDDGDAAGWTAALHARAFLVATERHTLGASCTFDAVEERQDLRRELTLGEDNGLRGYRARVLDGTHRLRCNLEHRFDTGLELGTFRFGLIAFHDAGWTDDDARLGAAFASIGAGLRVGSPPLLGDGVLRIDVAKPLDDLVDQSDGWKVSLTVGQVFTFGGNAGGLGVR